MKNILFAIAIIISFSAIAQQSKAKDSIAAMKTLIQAYNKAVNHDSSAYNPYLQASAYNDSLYGKAMAWRKWDVEYPIILNYLHMPDTSNVQTKRIIARLESNEVERNNLLKKAVTFFQQNGYSNTKPGSAPAANRSKPSAGKKGLTNNDAAIADSILKTWKF